MKTLTLFMLGSSGLWATTYCVDFSAGSDSNTGIPATNCHSANNHAWKHAPGMAGVTGTAASTTLVGDDQVIFKGGVAWPNASLPLTVNTSGTSGHPIQFGGLDKTWFTGSNSGTVNTTSGSATVTWASGNKFVTDGSWVGGSITVGGVNCAVSAVPMPSVLTVSGCSLGTQNGASYSNSLFVRPAFDGGSTGALGSLIDLGTGSVSYVTIDSLELKNFAYNGTYYLAMIKAAGRNQVITVQHSWLHNWSASSQDGAGNGAACFCGSNTQATWLHNSSDNTEASSGYGDGVEGAAEVAFSEFRNMSGNVHGSVRIHDNDIGPGRTNCCGMHEDLVISAGPMVVYNNLIHDGVAEALASQSTYGGGGTDYFYNNIIWHPGSDAPINIFADGGSAGSLQAYNNTIVTGGTGSCIANALHGTISSVTAINNLCITDTPGGNTQQAVLCDAGWNSANCSAVSTKVFATNTVLPAAQAASLGLAVGSLFIPSSGMTTIVGAGTNETGQCLGSLVALCASTTSGGMRAPIARPSSGAWDISAFAMTTQVTGVSSPINLLAAVQ